MASIFELENPTFATVFQSFPNETISADADLTVKQLINGLVIGNKASTALVLDLPKTQDILKALPDAVEADDSFIFTVKNKNSGNTTIRKNNNSDAGMDFSSSPLLSTANKDTTIYRFIIKEPKLKADGTPEANAIEMICISQSTTNN